MRSYVDEKVVFQQLIMKEFSFVSSVRTKVVGTLIASVNFISGTFSEKRERLGRYIFSNRATRLGAIAIFGQFLGSIGWF